MEQLRTISVNVMIQDSVENVWNAYNEAKDVEVWKRPSDDWHIASAYNNLRMGGGFIYRMEAMDKSTGINFIGFYDEVVPFEKLCHTLDDARKVCVKFIETESGTEVIETFEVDQTISCEGQSKGWQSTLNNLKKYLENNSK